MIRPWTQTIAAATLLAALPLGAGACGGKAKTYSTHVELARIQVVHTDAKGQAIDVDVEFEYPDCPGTQIEIIRGSAEFAACMGKYKVGDKVPASIDYHWDKRGYYDWDVHEMGGCKRPPSEYDESSFDKVEECEPIVVNGHEEGFKCNRIPQKELLKKCPWFARH
jgi:hypothetical protein